MFKKIFGFFKIFFARQGSFLVLSRWERGRGLCGFCIGFYHLGEQSAVLIGKLIFDQLLYFGQKSKLIAVHIGAVKAVVAQDINAAVVRLFPWDPPFRENKKHDK